MWRSLGAAGCCPRLSLSMKSSVAANIRCHALRAAPQTTVWCQGGRSCCTWAAMRASSQAAVTRAGRDVPCTPCYVFIVQHWTGADGYGRRESCEQGRRWGEGRRLEMTRSHR